MSKDAGLSAPDFVAGASHRHPELPEEPGELEIEQQMANLERSRTTDLYDRRTDPVSLEEVKRIVT